jgi:hypothetical protein
MASTLPSSFRSALERLKNAGAVNGLLLGWRRQTLINMLPFEEFRAERLLHEILDARSHFASGGDRNIQTFWFGYDTVHLLALFRGDTVLILLHTRSEEVDFLLHAATVCLEDTQLMLDSLLNPGPAQQAEASHAGEMPESSSRDTNFLGSMA